MPVSRFARFFSVSPAADPRPDGELLTRFLLDRDEAAITALVVRHAPGVRAVCRGWLRAACNPSQPPVGSGRNKPVLPGCRPCLSSRIRGQRELIRPQFGGFVNSLVATATPSQERKNVRFSLCALGGVPNFFPRKTFPSV